MPPPQLGRGNFNPYATQFNTSQYPTSSRIQGYNQPHLAVANTGNTGFLIKIIYGFLIMSMSMRPYEHEALAYKPCKPPHC